MFGKVLTDTSCKCTSAILECTKTLEIRKRQILAHIQSLWQKYLVCGVSWAKCNPCNPVRGGCESGEAWVRERGGVRWSNKSWGEQTTELTDSTDGLEMVADLLFSMGSLGRPKALIVCRTLPTLGTRVVASYHSVYVKTICLVMPPSPPVHQKLSYAFPSLVLPCSYDLSALLCDRKGGDA